MFWWEPESSGAIIIARAMPACGHVVCVGGMARVTVAVPEGVKPLVTGDVIPGVGGVCLVTGVAFELQAVNRNSKVSQPAMKEKMWSLREVECMISPGSMSFRVNCRARLIAATAD